MQVVACGGIENARKKSAAKERDIILTKCQTSSTEF
jgi:hypothetical protein